MPARKQGTDGDGKRFIGRTLQRFTHRQPPPEDCTHPHPHIVDVDGADEQSTALVCAECGRPLDVSHDPTLRRKQRLDDAKVCVDCGGPYFTVGTRRGL